MSSVLAIDDDGDALALIATALRGAGHEVVTCDDPARLPELVAAAPFDAFVLDVSMPVLSGYDLLRELRAGLRTRSLPVLFLSARGSAAERVRGLREGADDYLVKPYDPDELVLRVERMIASRAATGALAGDLEAFPLRDLLQSLARSASTGTVLMVSGERSAEIYVQRGKLIEARVGELSGESAMEAALDFLQGSFRFFDGELLGGVTAEGGVGVDAAALILRHASRAEEESRSAP